MSNVNTQTIENVKASIAATEARIAAAQALAQQWAAMQAAAELVNTTGPAELARLQSQLAQAEAAERVRQGSIARFQIKAITPNGDGFTVRFIERQHGIHGPENVEGTQALHGMSVELATAVMADPSKLPPQVLQLDADPEQALHKHAFRMRRGY